MRTVIHTLRLTEAEDRLLKAAAAARGTTISEVVRGPALREAEAVLEVVADREQPAPDRPEAT